MSDSNEFRTQVIYSTVHPRCGNRIARTDPKVITRADLASMLAEMKLKRKLPSIRLYCHYCEESVDPTHIEIIEDGKIIVAETKIERFVSGGRSTKSSGSPWRHLSFLVEYLRIDGKRKACFKDCEGQVFFQEAIATN